MIRSCCTSYQESPTDGISTSQHGQSSAGDIAFHARGLRALARRGQQAAEHDQELPRGRRATRRIPGRARDAARRREHPTRTRRVVSAGSTRPLLKPASAANRYRSLQQFFKWLVIEGQIKTSPMANMEPPKVPMDPPPVLGGHQLNALIKACARVGLRCPTRQGHDPRAARHRGPSQRAVGMKLGGRERGPLAASVGDRRRRQDRQAARRYRQGRDDGAPLVSPGPRRHPRADEPWLWLGLKGHLTSNGVAQMLRRRGAEAGIDHLNPHRFRHTLRPRLPRPVAGRKATSCGSLAGHRGRCSSGTAQRGRRHRATVR